MRRRCLENALVAPFPVGPTDPTGGCVASNRAASMGAARLLCAETPAGRVPMSLLPTPGQIPTIPAAHPEAPADICPRPRMVDQRVHRHSARRHRAGARRQLPACWQCLRRTAAPPPWSAPPKTKATSTLIRTPGITTCSPPGRAPVISRINAADPGRPRRGLTSISNPRNPSLVATASTATCAMWCRRASLQGALCRGQIRPRESPKTPAPEDACLRLRAADDIRCRR